VAVSLIEMGRDLWRGRTSEPGRDGPVEARAFASVRPRLFFSVRPLSGGSVAPRMQYAFVDADGEVLVNSVTGARDPAAVEPWDLEARLEALCAGADLVAHHRVLQAGLLPRACVDRAARVECVARAFERFSRRRGLHPEPGELLRLDQCLAFIGLPPVEGEDAVMQALSVRLLWRWMDTAR
jgi:hypothetical protein